MKKLSNEQLFILLAAQYKECLKRETLQVRVISESIVVIERQKEVIEEFEKNKPTFFDRFFDVIKGVALGIVITKVL